MSELPTGSPLIYPSPMEEKSRRAEYAETTRSALLEAGKSLFAEHGYADTSTEEIVRQARVTRGALYHHFAGKAELFEAVVEKLEGELLEQILEKASTAADPWEFISKGADAFLDVMLDPSVQRILLLDAPAVLGLEKWRQMDLRYSLGATQQALQTAMDAGAIEKQPVEPLAHMMMGALHNAGHYIVDSANPKKARKETGETLRRILEGLRTP